MAGRQVMMEVMARHKLSAHRAAPHFMDMLLDDIELYHLWDTGLEMAPDAVGAI
jgi:hypothetical protein